MYFEEIETLGEFPESRAKHTLCYNEVLNIIVLYGGENNRILNDLHIFKVDNFEWIKVQLVGLRLENRCAHSCVLSDTRMYIFGGYNELGFVSSDLRIVELDSGYSKFLFERYKNQ